MSTCNSITQNSLEDIAQKAAGIIIEAGKKFSPPHRSLEYINQHVTELSKLAHELGSAHSNHVAARRRARNELLPMYWLPTEILQGILLFALPTINPRKVLDCTDSDTLASTYYRQLFRYRSVCYRWHIVVSGSAFLWTILDAALHSELLSLALSRLSRKYAAQIFCHTPRPRPKYWLNDKDKDDDEKAEIERFAAGMLRMVDCVEKEGVAPEVVSLKIDHTRLQVFQSFLTSPAPLLTTLEIAHASGDKDFKFFGLFSGHAPKLHHVRLLSIVPGYNSVIFRGLRFLDLSQFRARQGPTTHQLLVILVGCPDIEHLTIQGTESDGSIPDIGAPLKLKCLRLREIQFSRWSLRAVAYILGHIGGLPSCERIKLLFCGPEVKQHEDVRLLLKMGLTHLLPDIRRAIHHGDEDDCFAIFKSDFEAFRSTLSNAFQLTLAVNMLLDAKIAVINWVTNTFGTPEKPIFTMLRYHMSNDWKEMLRSFNQPGLRVTSLVLMALRHDSKEDAQVLKRLFIYLGKPKMIQMSLSWPFEHMTSLSVEVLKGCVTFSDRILQMVRGRNGLNLAGVQHPSAAPAVRLPVAMKIALDGIRMQRKAYREVVGIVGHDNLETSLYR